MAAGVDVTPRFLGHLKVSIVYESCRNYDSKHLLLFILALHGVKIYRRRFVSNLTVNLFLDSVKIPVRYYEILIKN